MSSSGIQDDVMHEWDLNSARCCIWIGKGALPTSHATRGTAMTNLSQNHRLTKPWGVPMRGAVTLQAVAHVVCTTKMASLTSNGHWRPGGVGHEQGAAVSTHGALASKLAYESLQTAKAAFFCAVAYLSSNCPYLIAVQALNTGQRGPTYLSPSATPPAQ
jgi:hypothetical protein